MPTRLSRHYKYGKYIVLPTQINEVAEEDVFLPCFSYCKGKYYFQ